MLHGSFARRVAAAAGTLAICACSSGDDTVRPVPSSGTVTVVITVAPTSPPTPSSEATTTTVLDLDVYAAPTEYEALREGRAVDLIIASCAAEQGIEFAPAPLVDVHVVEARNALLLAPVTLEEVQQYGYAYGAHRRDAAMELGAAPDADASSSVNVEALLAGTRCGETAATRLGVIDRNIILGEFASAAAIIRQRADSEPEVVEALEVWGSCMAASGYDVGHPEDAIGLAEGMDGGVESPAAIDVAVADFHCKNESEYREVRDVARSELTASWLAQHPEAVGRLEQAQQHLNAQVGSVFGD